MQCSSWILAYVHYNSTTCFTCNTNKGKQSRNKCFVAKALWTELHSERTDMDLQHLFFDSTEELSRQGYFQWIYSLRAAGNSGNQCAALSFF